MSMMKLKVPCSDCGHGTQIEVELPEPSSQRPMGENEAWAVMVRWAALVIMSFCLALACGCWVTNAYDAVVADKAIEMAGQTNKPFVVEQLGGGFPQRWVVRPANEEELKKR